jgi:hypothetical protein
MRAAWPCACCEADSTSASVASRTVPDHVAWSAGLRTGRHGSRGPASASASSGDARQAAAGASQRQPERAQAVVVRQVEPARVGACVPYSAAAADRRMRQPVAPSCAAMRSTVATGSSTSVERNRRVGDAVHERGVGAVLQQAPHQVGQQRLVRAHRRVDAARPPQLALAHRAHHLLVQRLAHAVQALELVLPGV